MDSFKKYIKLLCCWLCWASSAYPGLLSVMLKPLPNLPAPAKSATAPKSGNQEELPLNITADRLEVDQNQQVVTFINKVVARYKDMIIYADLLKIFYQVQEGTYRRQPAGSIPARQISRRHTAKSKTAPPGNEGSPMDAVGIEKITRIEA